MRRRRHRLLCALDVGTTLSLLLPLNLLRRCLFTVPPALLLLLLLSLWLRPSTSSMWPVAAWLVWALLEPMSPVLSIVSRILTTVASMELSEVSTSNRDFSGRRVGGVATSSASLNALLALRPPSLWWLSSRLRR